MIKSKKVRSRVYNYKFAQALLAEGFDGESEEVKLVVDALAVTFGNCGWMPERSHMNIIINAAITSIGAFDDD